PPPHTARHAAARPVAASRERGSEHPLATAVVEGARERGIVDLPPTTDFGSHTGKGVVGVVEGHRVALGNAALLAELGVDAAPLETEADASRRNGQTVMLVAVDARPAGLVGGAD